MTAPSTDLEVYQNNGINHALAPQQVPQFISYEPMRDVVDGWVVTLAQVDQLANAIADTDFVPQALRGKPAAITACFLTGRELGIGPMASLKHVQMVDGTPSMSAEYKRARVLERGHEYEILALTKTTCKMRGRRRGQKTWTEFEYTIADARTAGLVRARSNWVTRPKRMLLARCSSDMCDAIFTDATNGLPTAELIGEELAETGSDLTAPAGTGSETGPVRRRRRTRAAAPEPDTDEPEQAEQPEQASDDDPELQDEFWDDPEEEDWPEEPEQGDGGEVADAEPMIEAGQLTRLQAQAKALRLDDEQRHRAASQITGREIASYSDLTDGEAETIIDIFAVAQRKDNPQAALKRLVASAVRDREDGGED